METSEHPTKKRSVTVAEMLLIAIILLLLAAILFPVFAIVHQEDRGQMFCSSNLRTLSKAHLQYAHDYDDAFPPAPRWQDALHSAQLQAHQLTSGAYHYARNAQALQTTASSTTVPLLYDSDNLAGNAHDSLPYASFSPWHRRRERWTFAPTKRYGGHVLYADGHVELKWRTVAHRKP